MAKIRYRTKNFRTEARSVIAQANLILAEYAAMGYDLTLRQLYYQFVARDLIANRQSEYNKLGTIINDGRMAGLIDWNRIVDRTRNLEQRPTWKDPAHIIRESAEQFAIKKWLDQDYYVEVWIEKDALLGVIEQTCEDNDIAVPYFSCRGYTSQSEMWRAAQRLGNRIDDGKHAVIIHLGDHDPSGIDMTRDIEDRIAWFIGSHAYWGDIAANLDETKGFDNDERLAWANRHFTVDRIALTSAQVEEYDPPPNPAKITDSRARAYMDKHGDESWELDALTPDVMDTLIRETVESYRDSAKWQAALDREADMIESLQGVSDRWEDVVAFING